MFEIVLTNAGTKETIDLTNKMADKGADAALVVTPAFFKSRMNSEAMMRHYTHVSSFQKNFSNYDIFMQMYVFF